jgi:serine/threonine protein kinase
MIQYFKSTTKEFFALISFEFSFRMNIYFSHQLANALEYLSNLNIVHNDIATRNCLFFSNYTIKLTDCAMALAQYEHQYWICTSGEKIPLRWIAPEALTVGNFIEENFVYTRSF